uniref:RING-type domain-containing protein n=1 Tax=Meloidogyne javanica TaxID=6303 RepID=A0A915MFZ0_MELJA
MNGQPDIIQNQQPPNYHAIHKSVIDMFPDLDLTKVLSDFGHLGSEQLADIILNTVKNIPKKRRASKRKASDVGLDAEGGPPSVGSEQSFTSENSNTIGRLLIDKMLWDMYQVLVSELNKSKELSKDGVNMNVLKTALADRFPTIRLEFISKMLSIFNGAVFPVAISCFFLENNFTEKLRRFLPSKFITANFWLTATAPLLKKRCKKTCVTVTDDFVKQFKSYTDLLAGYRDGEYGALLTPELKLSNQYDQVEWVRPPEEERIECLSESQVHAFCRTCVRGSASAAVGEIPMAKGGVGLRCMVPDCENPILYSEIRVLLSKEVQKKLDERIVEENLGMASLTNLERCKKCNFAIDMEVDKTVNKVFDCIACEYKMCRLCERDWDDEHFGYSCEELDAKNKKEKRDRALEKQLNEALIRKCPRCAVQFVKETGCNKMTCRCGMTQCYLCRESGIGYDHFCQHVRDPNRPWNEVCKTCKKKCLLHEDPKKRDEQLLKEIREKGVVDSPVPATNTDSVQIVRVQPPQQPPPALPPFVPPRLPWQNQPVDPRLPLGNQQRGGTPVPHERDLDFIRARVRQIRENLEGGYNQNLARYQQERDQDFERIRQREEFVRIRQNYLEEIRNDRNRWNNQQQWNNNNQQPQPIQPVQFVNGGFQMPPQPNNFAANPNRFEADGAFVPPQQPQFQQQQQQYVPQHPLPPPAFQHQQFQPHAHMPPQQIQQQQQQRPLINDWMEHYLGGDGFVNFGDFHDVPQAQPQQNQQQQQPLIHQIPPPAAIPLPPYPQQFPPPAQDIPLPPYPPPPQQEQLGDNFIGRNLGG